MASPRQRLLAALTDWMRDEARETVARWRGDPDASDPAAVAARHGAALLGARGRELFEEASERGLLAGDERAAAAAWLRDLHAAPGRARAAARLAEVLGTPIAHDSDFHAPLALVQRLLADGAARRRRAIARDLAPWLGRLAQALRDGRAEVAEARSRGAWLAAGGAPPDVAPEGLDEAAREVLRDTADAWQELIERLAHAAGTDLEHWTDLAHALRAPGLDDRFDPARRWRRLAGHLRPLGLQEALASRARAEPAAPTLARPAASLAVLHVPRDVRVAPGLELGLAAEREGALVLGRALAVALTNPALPHVLARPRAGTVGRALGGLLAHLHADPVFAERALGTSGHPQRAIRELALGLELWALRTEAARIRLIPEVDAAAFADAARELLRDAWRVEVDAAVAGVLGLPLGAPVAAFRAARHVPSLHVALRERFDEDWWRNPRAAEPLRAACARGGTLSVEAWADELGAEPGALRARVAELTG